MANSGPNTVAWDDPEKAWFKTLMAQVSSQPEDRDEEAETQGSSQPTSSGVSRAMVDLKGKARMRSPDAPTTSAALQDTSFLTQLHVPAACYQDQASDVSQTSSSGLEQPNVLPLGPAEPWAERCMHVRFQNGDTWDPLKQGEHGAYGGEGDVLGLHYDAGSTTSP